MFQHRYSCYHGDLFGCGTTHGYDIVLETVVGATMALSWDIVLLAGR